MPTNTVQRGGFHPFHLPFWVDGAPFPAEAQALVTVHTASHLLDGGAPGVGLLYSANYGQTREIESVYRAGAWHTGTTGSNQATVVAAIEVLLADEFASLQGRLHILPITTMNAYTDPVPDWNADVLRGIVHSDLTRVRAYLEAGWHVLGWQNQDTIDNPKHPYAIGGGVATLPEAVDRLIQATLMGLAREFLAARLP
jgi:hypothetical protein